MRDNDLFQLAPGITAPWFAAASHFDGSKKRLDIGVGFKAGSQPLRRDGILAWFDSRMATWLFEGINSLIQAAKAKARGHRNSKTLKAMTYLVAGKLDLRLPT